MLLLGPPRLQTSPQKTIEMEKRSFKKQTARRIVRGVVTLAPAVSTSKNSLSFISWFTFPVSVVFCLVLRQHGLSLAGKVYNVKSLHASPRVCMCACCVCSVYVRCASVWRSSWRSHAYDSACSSIFLWMC